MKDRRHTFQKALGIAEGLLLLGCGGLYLMDQIGGNGDQIVLSSNLSIISISLFFQLPLLLLYGISSRYAWLSNLSISLFSMFLILLGIELSMRLLSSKEQQGIVVKEGPFPYRSYDPLFFKDNHPHCSFDFILSQVDGGARIPIQINSQGIRGPEVAPKEAGQKRSLLIGDSFLQALQVPFEQTLGQQLERLSADSITFIQHGFPSYSPLLEFNWLLRKGINFEPNQVLLFIYMNDFFSGYQVGDTGYWPYTQFDQQGHPEGFTFDSKSLPGNLTIAAHLHKDLNRSVLFRWLHFRWRLSKLKANFSIDQFEALLQLPPEAYEKKYQKIERIDDPLTFFNWDLVAGLRDTSLWTNDLSERVDLSLGIFKKMNRFLAQKDISFGIVFIPFPWQFEGEGLASKALMGFEEVIFPYSGLQAKVQQFCQEEQIPLLDLYPAFKGYKELYPNRQLYYPYDRHWRVAGHQLAAETIHDFFIFPSTTKD